MEPTAQQILNSIYAVADQVTEMRGDALTQQDVSTAVTSGIKAAVSDPDVWAAAANALRHRAKEQAGGWLFGGLGAVLSRMAWIFVIGLGIYLLGGWTAVVAYFKAHP